MSETGDQNSGGFPPASGTVTAATERSAAEPKITDLELNAGSELKVVTARGTEDGLILRIDGKADWKDILHDINLFLGGRKKFFEGGQVSLEWLDRLPLVEQSKELETLLRANYGIEVVVRRRRPARFAFADQGAVRPEAVRAEGEEQEVIDADAASREGASKDSSGRDMSNRKTNRRSGVTINLFQEVSESADPSAAARTPGEKSRSEQSSYGLDNWNSQEREAAFQERSSRSETPAANFDLQYPESFPRGINASGKDFDAFGSSFGGEVNPKKYASRMAKMLGDDLFYEDDANAKVVFGTLRSGQRLETPFSLIVIGDVNPGADLVAGGDILVFGGLRGTAHASAYDDDAFDRVIIAMQMQPMQLRIGSVISRGSDELVKGAEIARIENRRIIVEAYNPRAQLSKKFR